MMTELICVGYININMWFVIPTTVLQKVTFGGHWVKGTQDLSILFLTTAGKSTIISKLKV